MRGVYVLAALCAAVLIAGAAAAQEPPAPAEPVTLTVEAGFSSRIKLEKWVPVRCIVENKSGERLRGALSISLPAGQGSARQTYSAAVDLPSPSRRRFTLYIYPQQYLDSISVQLAAGDVRITKQVPVLPLSTDDPIALVLTRGPVGLFALSRGPELGGLEVVEADISDLPEKAAGYETVDVIFYNGVSLRDLTPEQAQALRRWLLDGGTLVVATGRDWRFVKDSALEPLLPVEMQGGGEASIPQGARFRPAWLPALGGPFVLARAGWRKGCWVLSVDTTSVPLIARRDMGNGRVLYLSFDLSLPALLMHPEQPRFYQGLLASAGPLTQGPQPDPSPQPAWERNLARQRAAYQTAAARAPSLLWVIVFLSAYVLVIGPLDYLVLRRLRRRHLTVITFPVIVLAFTGVSYYCASSFKGRQVFVNEINILHQRGESVHVRTHFGVYSPRKTSYTISVNDPTATLLPLEEASAAASTPGATAGSGRWIVTPRGRFRIRIRWYSSSGRMLVLEGYPEEAMQEAAVQNAAFHITQSTGSIGLANAPFDMWAMSSFYADWWLDAGSVHTNLKYESDTIVGEIANNTRLSLYDCLLMCGSIGVPVGDFAAGAKRTIAVSYSVRQAARTFMEEDLIGGMDPEEHEARLAVLDSFGLRPWNVTGRRVRGRSDADIQAWGQASGQVVYARPRSRELTAGLAAFLGWARDPVLPLDVAGHRPGRRAINMWLASVRVDGLPEPGLYSSGGARYIRGRRATVVPGSPVR